MKIKINSRASGLIFGALAAAAYGLNPLFALPLYKLNMSADLVLFYRYFLGMLMLGVIIFVKRGSFRINMADLWSTLLGGILMAISSLTLYLSYLYMDAGLASTILFVYPVIVAVIMSVFFREKITRITIFSIILALAGLSLLACGGNSGSNVSAAGLYLSLGSALTYALYIVAIRKTPLAKMNSEKMTFYVLMFGFPVFFIRLNWGAELMLPPNALAWMCALGSAFFPTVIAFVFLALSILRVGATPAAILGVLEPVTALLVGVLVFGEALGWISIIGVVMIMAAVMLIVLNERSKE